jgi:RIO kinase 1
LASRMRMLDFDDLEYENIRASRRKKHFEDDDELQAGNQYPELDQFFAEGLISEVLYQVKSGKEAIVYCCRAEESLGGAELVAAKIYRNRNQRNFKNDAVYQEGRVILNGHDRRAIGKKSSFGREASFGYWIGYEWEHLKILKKAGAATPEPYRMAGSAILMEFMGDRSGAAPVLHNVELAEHEVEPLFNFVLEQVQLWLKNHLIHADLSPFNILYWEGKLKVIDFPQAVDPRFNPSAQDLLERDLANICRYWRNYGLDRDPAKLAREYWWCYQNNRL